MAVHCKAGKGRTGLAVCCLLLFLEACEDSYDSLEFFNKRRTTDGKVKKCSLIPLIGSECGQLKEIPSLL